MIRKNIIKEKMKNGEPVLQCPFCSTDPAYIEMMSMLGVDMIAINAEHMCYSEEQISHAIQAAAYRGGEVIVRTDSHDPTLLGHYLNMGAAGLEVTTIDSVEEVKRVIEGTRYFPIGKRGIGGGSSAMNYGINAPKTVDYLKMANENVYIGITIETVHGLNDLDEILKLDGIDMISFGPGDFACDYGLPGQAHAPEIEKLLTDAKEKILAANKYTDFDISSPDDIPALIKSHPACVVRLPSDQSILRKAVASFVQSLNSATGR